MFGLFSLFGPSREVARLNHAVREAGLHPYLVPDAVKLTVINLLKEAGGGESPDEDACAVAAELLVYCMLGSRQFSEANDASRREAAEARLEAALESGEGLDARLVLLALHAGVIEPHLADRYGIEAG